MWADTILRAEQHHLLALLVWAGLSILASTSIATILAARRIDSPLLRHFAIQMAAWGLVIGAIASIEWRFARLRDVSGATRLEHLAWMNVGLDVGFVGIGATLAVAAWLLGRRLPPLGAGSGIITQGLALLVIDLQFVGVLSR